MGVSWILDISEKKIWGGEGGGENSSTIPKKVSAPPPSAAPVADKQLGAGEDGTASRVYLASKRTIVLYVLHVISSSIRIRSIT